MKRQCINRIEGWYCIVPWYNKPSWYLQGGHQLWRLICHSTQSPSPWFVFRITTKTTQMRDRSVWVWGMLLCNACISWWGVCVSVNSTTAIKEGRIYFSALKVSITQPQPFRNKSNHLYWLAVLLCVVSMPKILFW